MGPRPRTWKRRAAEALSKSHNLASFEQLSGQRFYAVHLEAVPGLHRRGMDKIEINMDLRPVNAQGSASLSCTANSASNEAFALDSKMLDCTRFRCFIFLGR